MPQLQSPLAQLLVHTAAQDRAAFKALYDASHSHLFAVALRMLRNRALAEDALQESYVNVWQKAPSYQADPHAHDGHAQAWLAAIVRNKCLDYLRSKKRSKEEETDLENLPEDALGTNQSALDSFEAAMQASRIQTCMKDLSAAHKQCVALAFYQGLSHSEVAEHLGAPLGSVKAWIKRGLAQLKSCLAQSAGSL